MARCAFIPAAAEAEANALRKLWKSTVSVVAAPSDAQSPDVSMDGLPSGDDGGTGDAV